MSEEVELLRRLLTRVEELNCTMREVVKGIERLRPPSPEYRLRRDSPPGTAARKGLTHD